MALTFLVLFTITNEKTALTQIDRMLTTPKTFPEETRYNNSGRYNLLKFHILSMVSPFASVNAVESDADNF